MSPSSKLQSSVTWSHELPPVQASTTPVMHSNALWLSSLACSLTNLLKTVDSAEHH